MTTAERYAREWADKVRQATATRDRWMAVMAAEGLSVRKIAKVVGLPHATVARILARRRLVEPEG